MIAQRVIALIVLATFTLSTLSYDGSLLRAVTELATVPAAEAATGINPTIHYQGKVSGINGAAIANGSYNMRFKIFDAATSGTQLWAETWSNATQRVTMTGGLFSVALGTHVTMTGSVNFNTDNLYLQVEFDPGNDGTYEETFSPRRRFSSVPYAHNANTLDGLSSEKFLRKDQAETMSGTLTIKPNSASSIGLDILNTSGNAAVPGLRISTAGANHILFGSGGSVYDVNLYRFTANVLKTDDSFYAAGTISGSVLKANTLLTSSGALAVEGGANIDGSTFVVDASNNRVGIGTSAPKTALDVIGTLSGTALTVNGGATIGNTGQSHSLTVQGVGAAPLIVNSGNPHSYMSFRSSGVARGAVGWENSGAGGMAIMNSSNVAYLRVTDAGLVGIGNVTSPGSKLSVSGSTIINPTGTTGMTADAGLALEVIGTASGRVVYAKDSLRSSGSLVWEGAASGATLYVGGQFEGAGLSSCNGASQVVQWNSTTKRFGCATIVSSSFGSGNVVAIGDARYVNTSGDTMTGALAINVTGGTDSTLGLRVLNTFSGSIIRAQKQLSSSGTLAVDGVASFNNTVNVYGGSLLTMYRTDSAVAGTLAFQDNNTFNFSTELQIGGALRLNTTGIIGNGPIFQSTTGSPVRLYATPNNTSTFASVVLDSASTFAKGNILSIRNNTVEKMVVTATGSLGIGTTTPGSQLAVSGAVIINPNGNIGSSSADTNIALEIIGTASGRTLYAANSLRSSGSLVWEGAASGATLYVATSINGAGLTDCDLTTSKLQWDATTGRFSCGTDQTGGASFGSGNVVAIGDSRYVNTSGDTMTGALVIQNGNTHSATATPLLNVRGTMSGRLLQITGTGAATAPLLYMNGGRVGIGTNGPTAKLDVAGVTNDDIALRLRAGETSGGTTGYQILFSYDGSAQYTHAIRSRHNTAEVNNALDFYLFNPITDGVNAVGTRQVLSLTGYNEYSVGIGTTVPLGTLDVRMSSGAVKGVVVRGASASQTASMLELQNSAGTALAFINNSGALTLRPSASVREALNVVGTMSGTQLRVTGTGSAPQLMVGGGVARMSVADGKAFRLFRSDVPSRYIDFIADTNGSYTSINGSIGLSLESNQGSNQLILRGTQVIWNTAANLNDAGIERVAAGTLRVNTGTVGGNGTLYAAALSGYTLKAQKSLASSGTLVVEGTMSGAALYLGTSLQGAGLTDCDTAGSSKLLWDATTGRFSCGTDQTGGANFGSGNVFSIGDSRYVNTSGDTMTGALAINVTGGNLNTLGLRILNTLSGAHLHAEQQLTVSGTTILASRGAALKPLVVRGAASQSANLTEWQTNTGAIFGRVKPGGSMTLGSVSSFDGIGASAFFGLYAPSGRLMQLMSAGGNAMIVEQDGTVMLQSGGGQLNLGGNSSNTYAIRLSAAGILYETQYAHTFTHSAASQSLMIVRGASGQTGNLQEWQNSSSTALAFINNSGALTLRPSASVREALNVVGTMSGTQLRVTGTGSSPLLHTNGGRVGIGTTSLSAMFAVNGSAILGSTTGEGGLHIVSLVHDVVNLRPAGGNDRILISDDSATAERGMTIANLGNVGIGTAAPKAKLDVIGTISGALVHLGMGSASVPSLTFNGDTDTGLYRASQGGFRATVNGTDLVWFSSSNTLQMHQGAILAWGSSGVSTDDTNLYRGAANILKTDDSLYVVGTMSGSRIHVTGTGASTAPLLYTNGGRVGIGTTTLGKSMLTVSGTGTFRSPTGVAGTDELQIYHNGSNAVFNSPDGNMQFGGNYSMVFDFKTLAAGSRIDFAQIWAGGFGLYATSDRATLGGTSQFGFTAGDSYGAQDVGLARISAGIMRVSDGSTGYGNLYAGTMSGRALVVSGSGARPLISALRQNNRVDVNATIENGLVGWWGMDRIVGTGSIEDLSRFTATGTMVGGPTLVQGRFGKALSFDGTDDFLNLSRVVAQTQPITVAFWAKPNTSTPIGMFDTASGQNNVLRNYNAGQVEWHNGSPSINLNVSANQWVHLAFVYSYANGARKLEYYKNGALQATGSSSTVSTVGWTNLILGNINGGGNGWYSGALDDVRIYNRTLNKREVAELYRWNPLGYGGAILGNLRFESGSTLTVLSGSLVTVGSGSFTAAKKGEVALRVIGAYGQTANYQEWRNSTGTVVAGINPGAVVSGLGNNYFALYPSGIGGRHYRIGTYDGAGAFVFNRSDVSNYAGLTVNSTDVTFTSANTLILGGGTTNGLVLTPTGGGGLGVLQIGRRFSDSSAAVGASTEFWTYTGQTAPAISIKKPGGASGDYARFSATGGLAIYSTGALVLDVRGGASVRGTIENGLVGRWTMDAVSGTGVSVRDISATGNTGTLVNGAVLGMGKFGKAVDLDGNNDYVLIRNQAAINFAAAHTPRSYSAWVYLKANTNFPMFISRGGDELRLNATSRQPSVMIGGTGPTSPDAIALNEWHLLTATFDGTYKNIYVDGVFKARTSDSSAAANGDIAIGQRPAEVGTYPVNGMIDDVRIYNRALSAREVADLFTMSDYAQGGSMSGQLIVTGTGSSTVPLLYTKGGRVGVGTTTLGKGLLTVAGTGAFRSLTGTGGLDEIHVWHDGTKGVVQSKDGYLQLYGKGLASSTVLQIGTAADPDAIQLTSGSSGDGELYGLTTIPMYFGSSSFFGSVISGNTWKMHANGVFNWSSGNSPDPADIGLARLSAGVVKVTNGSTGMGTLYGGTLSGYVLKAQQSLNSSGALVWEGAASGATLYLGGSLQGAGLTDCDAAATSKLMWDATTGRFSCGTDQTVGTGLSFTTGDERYVNIAGDTMTGALVIQNGNTHSATYTPLLNVRGTMSGRYLNIMGTGSTALIGTSDRRVTVNGTLENGLVGHWTMDAMSGSTAIGDSSMYSNSGQLLNGPTLVPGKFGRAVQFDGVNDYMAFSPNVMAQMTTEATFSVWLKNRNNIPSASARTGLERFGQGSTSHFPWTDGQMYVSAFRGTRFDNVNVSAIDKTQWNLLTITTRPGTNGYVVYINGKIVGMTTGESTISKPTTPMLGGNAVTGTYYDGLMDDFRLYNRALSPREVMELYRQSDYTVGGTMSGRLIVENAVTIGSGAILTNGSGKLAIFTTNGDNVPAIYIRSRETTSTQDMFRIITDVGSTNNTVFRVTASGGVFSDAPYNASGADYAEYFYSSTPDLQFGEIVCLDTAKKATVKRCASSADSNVIGIVSSPSQAAFIGNRFTGAEGLPIPNTALVGLLGQLQAKVIVESGAQIQIGDQLTPSATPGYARRAMFGESTVGVAMEPFSGAEGAKGEVSTLVARKNSSLTADAVSDRVLETVRALKIDEQLQQGLARAVEGMTASGTLAQPIRDEVARQMAGFVSVEDRIASLERRIASLSGATVGGASSAEIAALAERVAYLEAHPAAATLTGAVADISARTLALESTLSVGTDARIAGDLHLDGTFHVNDLFIPGALSVDGTLNASRIVAGTGSVFAGAVRVEGDLEIANRLTFASGSVLTADQLIVRGGLAIIGDVTIEGIAIFFKDVKVKGELIVSNRQAGYAEIPLTGTAVTVRFSSGFVATPIVTASPDVPVLYAVSKATATGFTIRISGPATEKITFSWLALATENPQTATAAGAHAAAQIGFTVDKFGVPVSSNEIWNACIRNQVTLDGSGQPYSCDRYHDRHTWTHPDLDVSFLWNTALTPPLLVLPDGYRIQVVGGEEEMLDGIGETGEPDGGASTDSQSSVSSAEQSSSSSSAALDGDASTASSESSASSVTESSVSSAAASSEQASSEPAPAASSEAAPAEQASSAAGEPAPSESVPAETPAGE